MGRLLGLILIGWMVCFASVAEARHFTPEEAKKFVEEEWFPAWTGGAPAVEGLLKFFGPDAIYIDPNVPKGLKGADEMRPFFTTMLSNNPNWKFRLVAVYPIEKGLVIHWSADIPHGSTVIKDLHGADIMKFENGVISHLQEFFDLSVFRSSAGAPAP